jgi:hypothetical protein
MSDREIDIATDSPRGWLATHFRQWCGEQTPMPLSPRWTRRRTTRRIPLGQGKLPLYVALREGHGLAWVELRVVAYWLGGYWDTLYCHRVFPRQFALCGEDEVMQPLPNWYDASWPGFQVTHRIEDTLPSLAALVVNHLFVPWWQWLHEFASTNDWLLIATTPDHRPRAIALRYDEALPTEVIALEWHDLRGLARIPPWPSAALRAMRQARASARFIANYHADDKLSKFG